MPLHDGAVIIRGDSCCYNVTLSPAPFQIIIMVLIALAAQGTEQVKVGISEVTDSMDDYWYLEETKVFLVAAGGELFMILMRDSLRNKLEYLRRRTHYVFAQDMERKAKSNEV